MALIDDVKTLCNRLAPHGWRELLRLHGLDITAADLEQELAKNLPNIRRDLKGFEDFASEARRGIEPGNPARSLLFHALASPNVVKAANGADLAEFPTLAEIEIVENYVYRVKPPSLLELRARAQGAFLAIVVFALEYRPAPETVHQKHADMCFSRTGVARVGTADPLYEPRHRGFLPFVAGDNHAIRVLPAHYSAYIAMQHKGDRDAFGPMRFREGDENRAFWVPLHKLFSGLECIRGLDLHVTLTAHHTNEKLRRVHLELGRQGIDTGWREPDISQPPFIFTADIADWSTNQISGTGLLVPVAHSELVKPAEYQGEPLTFKVPVSAQTLSSSLSIPAESNSAGDPTWRHAPEYVHVRHRVRQNGTEENLNDKRDVVREVRRGGYRARHYIDFTGDGWIEAICPELAVEIPRRVPAYSLVTAPDFFPNCDQRELMDWWERSVTQSLRRSVWRIPPLTLSDERIAPNLQLTGADFRPEDKTVTAIVSLPLEGPVQQMPLDIPETSRHSYLPDAAAGVFAPGWDVSLGRTRTPDRTEHLAAYGLGSPFPEDAKLCAALSTFWPGVAPDAARTFEPNPIWPTVSPLTEEESGQVGNLPWDGVPGPQIVHVGNRDVVEYPSFAHADYVESALHNQFSLTRTGQVDIREYRARVLSMARVYRALGIREEDFFRPGIPEDQAFGNIVREKAQWSVLSFRKVALPDQQLQQAQGQTNTVLQGTIYRFQIYRHGNQSQPQGNHRKRRVEIGEMVTLYVDPVRILLQRGAGAWEVSNV